LTSNKYDLFIDFNLLEEQMELIDGYLLDEKGKDRELLLGLSLLLDVIRSQRLSRNRTVTLEVVRVAQQASEVDLD
jgi:hypothetical protein